MTRSRDSALGTCPATLSHLVGLFGIDVEDISRAAKRGQSCEGHARKKRCSPGAPSALLAMYDRLEWTSAIKLHFRGIRASLNCRLLRRVLCVCHFSCPLGQGRDMSIQGAYASGDKASHACKIKGACHSPS